MSLFKRDQKLRKRAVNTVEPSIPRYLRWSEQPIVWSREDHPPRVDNPSHLALVAAPQVGGYKFTKVLMDGGRSINILYYDTFRRMGLTDKNLKPSNTVFHGVVPGKTAYPVGKIDLEVAFGDERDSRAETLTFEVVKIRSPYHAIFGRPAYAKFMARPCYLYLLSPSSGTRIGRSWYMVCSWQGHVMFIYILKCQVIRGLSQYMEAERSLWNVRKVMRLMLSRFVLRRS